METESSQEQDESVITYKLENTNIIDKATNQEPRQAEMIPTNVDLEPKGVEVEDNEE